MKDTFQEGMIIQTELAYSALEWIKDNTELISAKSDISAFIKLEKYIEQQHEKETYRNAARQNAQLALYDLSFAETQELRYELKEILQKYIDI